MSNEPKVGQMVIVDDGKGKGETLKRFVREGDDSDVESDKSIIQPLDEDFYNLHFYYNYNSHVASEAAKSPLLFEVL